MKPNFFGKYFDDIDLFFLNIKKVKAIKNLERRNSESVDCLLDFRVNPVLPLNNGGKIRS